MEGKWEEEWEVKEEDFYHLFNDQDGQESVFKIIMLRDLAPLPLERCCCGKCLTDTEGKCEEDSTLLRSQDSQESLEDCYAKRRCCCGKLLTGGKVMLKDHDIKILWFRFDGGWTKHNDTDRE